MTDTNTPNRSAIGDEPADTAPALGIVETLAVYVDDHVTIRLTNGDELAGKLYGPVADHNGDLVALAFRRYATEATPMQAFEYVQTAPVSVIPWHAVALLERRR